MQITMEATDDGTRAEEFVGGVLLDVLGQAPEDLAVLER